MRESRLIMADLAATGLSADQSALLMELVAALSIGAPTTHQEPDNRSPAARRQAEYRQRTAIEKASASITPDVTSDVTDVTRDVSDVTLRNGRNGPRQLRSIAHQAVLEIWNDMAERTGLPKALTATGKRQAMLRERLKEHGEDAFRRAVEAVERSPFCLGKNERGWRADIGFLLRPDNFVKLIEGGFGPREEPKRAPKPWTADELRRGIRWAEDNDDPDRAAELKAQLDALQSADPKVARLVSGVAQSLRAGAH